MCASKITSYGVELWSNTPLAAGIVSESFPSRCSCHGELFRNALSFTCVLLGLSFFWLLCDNLISFNILLLSCHLISALQMILVRFL